MNIINIKILPNESFYSFLSRLYVHSGIANHIEFRKMVFKRSNEYLDYNDKKININDLLMITDVLITDYSSVIFE